MKFRAQLIVGHCIIQHECLYTIIIGFDYVMPTVVSAINLIKSNGLNHNEFEQISADI
jgi:hypothetical protein